MYLQKIQLNGFKSFVDKTKIELNPGVTCIVGPNGSGKSNIADAMRWVLGEQSIRSLRGIKMEDVIFAGSKKRKPVGRAEVNIILDNSKNFFPLEYSEIIITRRLYRSGESQYLINKVPCRLKDIQEIFMDTGLGKESFSIIGQGKVDWIIYSTPEERRPIFEEAAGITKYRYRKKETLKKIEKTQANLTRITDVLFEIENQINPLSEQAKKAENYLNKKRDLNEKEITVNYYYLKKIKKDLDLTSLKIKNSNVELLLLQNIQNIFLVKEEEIKLLSVNLEDNISIISKRKSFVEQKKSDSEAEKLVNNEKYNNLSVQLKSNQQKIVNLNNELKNLHMQYEEKNNLLNLCKEDKKRTQSEIDLMQLHLEKKEFEIKDLNEKEFNLDNNKITEHNKISSLETDIINYEQRKRFIEIQNNKKSELKDKKSSKKIFIENQIKEKKYIRSELEDSIENINIKINRNQTNVNEKKEKAFILNNKKNIINEKILKLQSQYSFIKGMQDKMDGYYKGVKTILEAKNKKVSLVSGVLGVIAELINVPAQYETAVETALGSSLQNLVTYTDEDAKKAIAYLKKTSGGRATFLPLNVIKNKQNKSINDELNLDGVKGIASDLVMCESSLSPIINFLLGKIIVVENINHALNAARKTQYKYKIVTLDGEVFNPGGSITGGDKIKNKFNLLGRSKKLLNIKEEEKELQKNKETLCSSLEKLEREQEKLLVDINKLSDEKENLLNLHKKTINEINILEENKKNIEDEIKILKLEYEQMEYEVKEINEKKHKIKNKLNDLKENSKKNLKVLEGLKHDRIKLNNEREKIKNNLSELKVSLNVFKEKKDGLNIFIDDLNVRIDKINKEKLIIEDDLENIKIKKENILSEKDNLEKQINKYKNELKVLNSIIKLLLKNKMLIKNKGDELFKIINMISNKTSAMNNRLQKYEITKARLEEGYKTTKNKIIEKHGTFKEDIKELPTSDIKNIENIIIKLKKELNMFGEVNIGAIEQLKELKRRYSFLNEQKKDLIKACDELKYVIKKIDSTMAKRFRKTFDKVNDNFNKIFNFLFCGGKAFLKLDNDKNILDTGINIEVQPPGKNMQNISLLSGGEKSLTAISLLFAFLKVKPSPFCVLDEIDAYLDESNVKRFADFLYNFSEQTQFLVITHRQATMEIADSLYGVTMQEPGVSKLVSVKLKKDEIVSNV